MSQITRRALLQMGALLPAAKAAAPAKARILGANDRIQVAYIGVGGKGFSHVKALAGVGDVQITGAADVYSKRRERFREFARLEERQVHRDYREMLTRSDVDAVFIATPDHWHGRMAIEAMAAGKDVYLEKPMTLTIEEAWQIREAAKKQERVLQVGSQHLSDLRHQKARELIQAGEIGTLLWAQNSYSRNSANGEWNYFIEPEGTPETIDWTRWLGSAPKRPFSAERYFRWRKYWDYSGGIATDLFYHRLAPLHYAMGAGFPTRVAAHGGIYVQKDREVPDTYATVIEYPDFYINLSSSMANAAGNQNFPTAIYGNRGTITYGENQVTVTPEFGGTPKVHAVAAHDMSVLHRANFLSCMRTRKATALPPELGYQVMTAIRLGVDAYREGRVKGYDPKTRKVTEQFLPRPQYEGKGVNFENARRRG